MSQPLDPLGSPIARLAFESTTEGMFILSPEGIVLAINSSFCKLYDITPDDIVGQHHSSFTKDLEVRRLGESVGQSLWVTSSALKGEAVPETMQAVRNRATGTEIYVRATATPLYREGKFVATAITALDITKEWLAQQNLDSALSASEVGIYRTNLVDRSVEADSNFARIHGMTAEEVDSGSVERIYELMHEEDKKRILERVTEVSSTGGTHEFEYRVLLPDGNIRWLMSRGKTYLDAQGKPVQRVGSVLNITAQKIAQQNLEMAAKTFETLVQDSPFGIYVVDADFCLVLVSKGAMKVFENVRPLLGRDFEEVMRTVWEEPFASEAIRLFRHTLETGEPYHSPSTVETRQDLGETESYDWKIERITMPDGRLAAVCHFYDLSERQRYEAELEQRVTERTADLMASNEALNGFTYHVAHDLRTPLRSIVSTSRILQEDFGDQLPEEANELLESQVKAASRLGHLIDDLLRLSKIAQQEAERAMFDMTALAKDMAVEALDAHPGSTVVVEVQDWMMVQADPGLVRLALGNLIENAVKYSPAGGTVKVGRRDDGTFFVSDQGIGIDPAYFEKIFEPFQRLHRDHEFAGTGIGLSNVQQVVQRHSGKLWVESKPNQGSTFFFTLGS